jgi:uncharacterized protein involved in exopolysaccharide biosynthesis
MNLFLRHPLLIVGLPLALFAWVVGTGLLGRRSYSASAAFMPQVSQSPRSQLSGLAAQFGITVSAGETGQTPAFYVELLRSREILGRVVDTRYTVVTDTGKVTGTLLDYYNAPGKTPAERRETAIQWLDEAIKANPGLKTGIVRFSVSASYPTLALQIAQKILAELNDFNLNGRRSRAGAERRFVEQRMQEARADLAQAEERLQGFLQGNREFVSASELAFRRDRLEREILMRQQLYTSLAQSYEQARIDEVRDTPVITLVEPPVLPARPERRGLVRKGLLALILGGSLGVVLALALDSFSGKRKEGAPEFVEFESLASHFAARWRRPFGRSRTRSPRSPPA